MEKGKESVSKIIEANTLESLNDFNLTSIISLTERIKTNRKEAKEAVTKFTQIFKTEKYKRIYLALQIIEVFSKNGSLEFHEYLSQEDFMKEFMKWFKILRGKGGLFSRFESTGKKEMREKNQEQALYLLQLWSDTFMMYQDQYPGFQKYYRELKVEGIKFPERDFNERTMMENLEGISSPMYDFVEQTKKDKENSKDIRKSNFSNGKKSIPKNIIEEDPVDEISPDLEAGIKEFQVKIDTIKSMNDFIDEDPSDLDEIQEINYSKYEREIFDKSEFDVAKSNIKILENMVSNCENFTDIWTNVIVDLYQTALKSTMKISKIMEVRKKAKFIGDKETLLQETVTEIQGKIEEFRKKYLKLKKRELKNFENHKRILTRQLRKQEKLKRKQQRLREKSENMSKQKKEQNPFDVLDETEKVIGYVWAANTQAIKIEDAESSSESSSESDIGNNNEESDDSDSDGLYQPVSMWSILYYGREKEKQKEQKKKEKEKLRASQIETNKENQTANFLRSSVLVQKTMNFFGRSNKPFATTNNEQKVDSRKSNINGDINNYFIQTANKNNEEDKEIFDKSPKIEDDEKLIDKEDKDNIDWEKIEVEFNAQKSKPPVVPSKSKQKSDIPLHKSKSKANRDSVAIKKIININLILNLIRIKMSL